MDTGKTSMWRRDRDGSDAPVSQEMPGAARSREARKGPPLEAPEGSWPFQHLVFTPLLSRAVRK